MTDTYTLAKEEEEILHLMKDVWNAFVKLPEQHPTDQSEVATLVHSIQDKIAARPAYRWMKARGNKVTSPEEEIWFT